MDDDEVEEDCEDEWAWVSVRHAFARWWFWRPIGAEYTFFNGLVDLGGVRFGVGEEELGVEL